MRQSVISELEAVLLTAVFAVNSHEAYVTVVRTALCAAPNDITDILQRGLRFDNRDQ